MSFTASSTEFVEFSDIKRFADNSGFVAKIRVGAREYSCAGKSFYFHELPSFLTQLKQSFLDLRGCAELRHRYEEEFVRFEFTPRGHVIVSGLLRETPGCRLQFIFEADQTFVPPFISSVERVLSELFTA